MSLSDISIRRPVFAWMLMFGLIVFGAISFSRMGISSMPDVDFPVVNIELQLDNAAPEVMEVNVVDIVEDAVMGIDGLKRVSSNISQGTANVTCEFQMNRNIDVAMQEVQNRILQVNNRLPSLLYPPVITKTNPEDQPILWIMLTADEGIPLSQQMMYARNTLKDQFSTIDGVGTVLLSGYVDPNLRVWVDPKKLNSFEFTSSDVITAIQTEQTEQPAGRIETPTHEMNVRVLGETTTPEDFSKIRLNSRGGATNYNPISISNVAKVEEGVSDLRAISRYNGKVAVGLGIVKQHGSNAVRVGQAVRDKVEKIRPFLFPGYHMDIHLDSTKFIRESVNELNFTLLVAAILTSLVCYLFLGSWSSTINVLLAIPTSIMGTFIVLYFFGFTLNTFTLLGLSLAIGIVVDDAIMMLENIVRHRELGKSKRQAALDGSNEITFAAFATTLAIAAIFIPVIFMKGAVGAFFYQYGITVTAAVFLSLLEALTLTPMRCARFLQSTREHSNKLIKVVDDLMSKLAKSYRKSLDRVLDHQRVVVLGSLGLFLASLVFVSTLPKELIPSQDQSYFALHLKLPTGTSIEVTDETFKKVELYLKTVPEVQDYYSTIGNYEHNNIVNAGTIHVILKDLKDRKKSQSKVMEQVRAAISKNFPEMEAFAQDLSITGFSASRGFPIEFTVEGPEWGRLRSLTDQLIQKLNGTGLVQDINMDYQDGMSEIDIVPDRDKTAQRGMTVTSIGQEVQNLVGGNLFSSNTEYPKDGHRYYIRLRSKAGEFSDPAQIAKIKVRNNRGQMISVGDSVQIKNVKAPQVITRYNRERAIPVFGNIVSGKSQSEALAQVENIAKEILPPGYDVRITGSGAGFREAFDGLVFALLLGVAVAYLILASQFNSFIHPISILMALPFSLSGALLALTLAHQSLSLFSMIGLILLMGIVKKNSILLVDFTNQRRADGLGLRQALLEACPIRLRPILMTSVATVVGAIPGALNFGPGAETRVPMAISIIGGVLLSTFLTLYVVPCVYSMLSRFERPETEELLAT